jgi:hypothetical protein
MRRTMLLVTVALVMAVMLALPGAALANHGAAHGGGGHIEHTATFSTFTGGVGGSTGGVGGSDKGGSGGGGHTTTDHSPFIVRNIGEGSGGSDQGGGGGGGGCVTVATDLGGTGERECGGEGSGGSTR